MPHFTPLAILLFFLSTEIVAILSASLFSPFSCAQEELPLMPMEERKKEEKPSPSFTLQQELHSPSFQLHTSPSKVSMPDLRYYLLFFGALERPDSDTKIPLLRLGLRGESEWINLRADTSLHLKYNGAKNQYEVTKKSPLQLSFKPLDKSVQVTVTLTTLGTTSSELATPVTFILSETPLPPSKQTEKWSDDKVAFDSHVFERMNAKWWGTDVLFDTLSTDEKKKGRNRIVLNSNEGSYTIWAKSGDCFTWEEDRFVEAIAGQKSRNKILLETKEEKDSTLSFLLWNRDGSMVIPLNLQKTQKTEASSLPTINLIGARSRNMWVATINSERMILKTDDWLLCSHNAIEKIESPEQLDEYLQGKKEGTLLAFSGVEHSGGDHNLVGVMVDSSRTNTTPISVSLFHSWNQKQNDAIEKNVLAKNKGHDAHHSRDRHDEDSDDDLYSDDEDSSDDDNEDDEFNDMD